MAIANGNDFSNENAQKILRKFVDSIASFEVDSFGSSPRSSRSEFTSAAISLKYIKEIEAILQKTEEAIKKIESQKKTADMLSIKNKLTEKDLELLILDLRRQEAEEILSVRKQEQDAQDKLNEALWKNYTIQEKLNYARFKSDEIQKEIDFLEDKKRAEQELSDEEQQRLNELIEQRDDANERYFNVRKALILALAKEERIQKYKTEVEKIEQEKKAQKELNKLENKDDKQKLKQREALIDKEAKAKLKKAADFYGVSKMQEYSADEDTKEKAGRISAIATAISGGPRGISSAIDEVLGKSSPVVAALMSVVKIVGSINAAVSLGVLKAMSSLISYMGQINARLQKSSDDTTDYYKLMIDWSNESALRLEGLGLYIGSVNAIVEKSKYIDNLNSLVLSGIVRNAEERAMIQTLTSRMVTTFDTMDASLTRLIRLQLRDITYTALGQESLLNKFLGLLFQDTSYLNSMYDSVNSILLDATAKMASDLASAFSYEVQKWLGALYSQGLSESGVQELAKGITYLSTGDINNLSSNQALQYIYASAAERAGLSYADILTRGLDIETTNELLQNVVEVLRDIYLNSLTNVVLSAWSNITGLSISDLRSTINVSDDIINQIKASHVSWVDAIDETRSQLTLVTSLYRTSIPEIVENFVNNAMMTAGEKIVLSTDDPSLDLLGQALRSDYLKFYVGLALGGTIGNIISGAATLPAIRLTVEDIIEYNRNNPTNKDDAFTTILTQVEKDLIFDRDYGFRQTRGSSHTSGRLPSQGLSYSQVDYIEDVQSAIDASRYLSRIAANLHISAEDYLRYTDSYEALASTSSTPIVSLAQTAAAVESAAQTIVNESEEDRALLNEATDISYYLFENEKTIRISLARVEDAAKDSLMKALNIEGNSDLLLKINDKLHYKIDVDLIDNDVNSILSGILSVKWGM